MSHRDSRIVGLMQVLPDLNEPKLQVLSKVAELLRGSHGTAWAAVFRRTVAEGLPPVDPKKLFKFITAVSIPVDENVSHEEMDSWLSRMAEGKRLSVMPEAEEYLGSQGWRFKNNDFPGGEIQVFELTTEASREDVLRFSAVRSFARETFEGYLALLLMNVSGEVDEEEYAKAGFVKPVGDDYHRYLFPVDGRICELRCDIPADVTREIYYDCWRLSTDKHPESDTVLYPQGSRVFFWKPHES